MQLVILKCIKNVNKPINMVFIFFYSMQLRVMNDCRTLIFKKAQKHSTQLRTVSRNLHKHHSDTLPSSLN